MLDQPLLWPPECWFPSPCGEEVMKLKALTVFIRCLGGLVSVPLRGRGHEITAVTDSLYRVKTHSLGFRPLAGKRS